MKKVVVMLMLALGFSLASAQVSVEVVDTDFYWDGYDFTVVVHDGPSDSIMVNGMQIPSPRFKGANYGTTYIVAVGSSADTLYVSGPPAFTMPAVTFITDTSFIFDILPFDYFYDQYDVVVIGDSLISLIWRTSYAMTRTKYTSFGGRIKAVLIKHALSQDVLFKNPLVSDTITFYDTTYINNFIHDTTYVYVHDTLTLHDTVWLTQTDTLWLYDTVYIHDTVYITQEGIDGMEVINARVYSNNQGQIVVDGAAGNTVWLYDINGRVLATKRDEYIPLRFNAPASGTYLIKIGNYPAREVVVVQ